MFFKKQEPALNHSRLLDSIPARNQALRVEERQGALVLWVPLRERWWMRGPVSWVFPFRREKGIELDALGRQVFEACDGHKRLEEIIDSFAERHQLRFHEARLSVVSFLDALVERKLVAIAIPEDALIAAPAQRQKEGAS